MGSKFPSKQHFTMYGTGPIEDMIMREIDDQENREYLSAFCDRNKLQETGIRRSLYGYKIRHGERLIDPTYIPGTPQFKAMSCFSNYRDKLTVAIGREEKAGNLHRVEYFKRHRADYTILSKIVLKEYNNLRTIDDANSLLNDLYEAFDTDDDEDIDFQHPKFEIFSLAKMIQFIKFQEKKGSWMIGPTKVFISKAIGKLYYKIEEYEELLQSFEGLGLSESVARQFFEQKKRKPNLRGVRIYVRIRGELRRIEYEKNLYAQKQFYASIASLIHFSNHGYFLDNNENCPLLPYPEIRRECTQIALSNEDRTRIIRTIDRALDNWYKRHPMMSDELRLLINQLGKGRLAAGHLGLHAAAGDYLSCMDLYWVTDVCDIYLTSLRTLDSNIYYGLQWRESVLTSREAPKTYDEYLDRYHKALKIYREDAAEESIPK